MSSLFASLLRGGSSTLNLWVIEETILGQPRAGDLMAPITKKLFQVFATVRPATNFVTASLEDTPKLSVKIIK